MLRITLLALLPQIGGMLLLITRRARDREFGSIGKVAL
jgi:hypothetical protein